jgi:hypothetical protein
MRYNSTGLVVHDADAHVMETPNHDNFVDMMGAGLGAVTQ